MSGGGLSSKTVETYQLALKKLRDAVAPGSSGYDYLLEAEKIVAHIETQDWSVNTRKNYYIALKSTIRSLNDDRFREAAEKYTEKMLHYRDMNAETAAKQELSAREKELFVAWPDILKKREEIREAVSNLSDFQDYVIYCLYTLQPPVRVDYSPCRVIAAGEDWSGNSLRVGPKSMQFVLREYKTAAKYGPLTLDVPRKLEEVLREWLELQPSGWLLCDSCGEPMNEQMLSRKVRDIFKKWFGKALGVNILRHSYITYMRKGEKKLSVQEDVARRMGHSIRMSQIYRRTDA